MKKTKKTSSIVINFHVPSERTHRALACIRLLNRTCGQRALEVVTVSRCRWHTLIAAEVSLMTCEVHELTDIMQALYFISGRCDFCLQDINLVHK